MWNVLKIFFWFTNGPFWTRQSVSSLRIIYQVCTTSKCIICNSGPVEHTGTVGICPHLFTQIHQPYSNQGGRLYPLLGLSPLDLKMFHQACNCAFIFNEPWINQYGGGGSYASFLGTELKQSFSYLSEWITYRRFCAQTFSKFNFIAGGKNSTTKVFFPSNYWPIQIKNKEPVIITLHILNSLINKKAHFFLEFFPQYFQFFI